MSAAITFCENRASPSRIKPLAPMCVTPGVAIGECPGRLSLIEYVRGERTLSKWTKRGSLNDVSKWMIIDGIRVRKIGALRRPRSMYDRGGYERRKRLASINRTHSRSIDSVDLCRIRLFILLPTATYVDDTAILAAHTAIEASFTRKPLLHPEVPKEVENQS